MILEDVIKEAAARGVPGLPLVTRLTHARVWPGAAQWVAEVGEPPHNETVGDGMYDSKEEAEAAALRAVAERRARLVALLPAELAATATDWADPVVSIWEA